jgi:4-hydroxybenzoate polyprenyltransferase
MEVSQDTPPAQLATPEKPGLLAALIKELRPHQWAKNALVLVPAALAPGLPNPTLLSRGLLAAFTFSLCASAGYILNDLLDLEADRAHPTKKNRPFASGALPPVLGPPMGIALVVVSFALAYLYLPGKFVLMLAIYLAGTILYSLFLKKQLLIDVLVLAGLYAHRVLSGGVATQLTVSAWLIGFSIFLFTSLAFCKRYVELRDLTSDGRIKNRGYFRADLQMVTSMGTASAFLSALVFVLYVDSGAVRSAYQEPDILWLALPILLYWIGRIWLLAGRGQMLDDPVRFALKDKRSLVCGGLIGGLLALARFPPAWLVPLFH